MNTQPEDILQSLGELIRTVSRISNNTMFELNQTDRDRLEKAKNIISKYSEVDKSQTPIQSVALIGKTLSAEEYMSSQVNINPVMLWSNIGVIGMMKGYANLRVEQAKEEWEKEKEYVLKIAVNAIYFDDRADYSRALYSIIGKLSEYESLRSSDIKELFAKLNP